jgi:hypothetical protein
MYGTQGTILVGAEMTILSKKNPGCQHPQGLNPPYFKV